MRCTHPSLHSPSFRPLPNHSARPPPRLSSDSAPNVPPISAPGAARPVRPPHPFASATHGVAPQPVRSLAGPHCRAYTCCTMAYVMLPRRAVSIQRGLQTLRHPLVSPLRAPAPHRTCPPAVIALPRRPQCITLPCTLRTQRRRVNGNEYTIT